MSRTSELAEQAWCAVLLALGAATVAVLAVPLLLLRLERHRPMTRRMS